MSLTAEPPVRSKSDRPKLILGICCMSLLLVSMDVTIVNVALPSIQHDLHASLSGLQWILDAYTLVVASLLMLSGSVADRLGRRRVFQIGLALFTAGSVLCSLAPSINGLIAFRAMQGLGASMLNPVALSIIANSFKEPRARAHAIGIWGAVAGISFALGPMIGGALTEAVGWRSIFWINLPIGLQAIVLSALYVPESKAVRARAFDPLGQLLVFLVLASITSAVIEGPHVGWKSPMILSLFAGSGLLLATFLVYEPRIKEPLLDLRFFRSVPFSSATVIALCSFASFAGFLFLNALYLQQVRGLSAFHTGLCTLPFALYHDHLCAAVWKTAGQPRHTTLTADCRRDFPDQHRDSHRPPCRYAAAFTDRGLPAFRHRTWHGQSRDCQQCRRWYALIAGRRRSCDCIHQPAGGSGAGRSRGGHGGEHKPRSWCGFRAGNTQHLVDHGRLQRRHLPARLGVQYALGAHKREWRRASAGRVQPRLANQTLHSAY